MGGSPQASEVGEDIAALRLLRRSGAGSESDSESESENDGVLMSEGEEQEEVDESSFGNLMTSAVERSMCVCQWFLRCLMPELTICHIDRERNFG